MQCICLCMIITKVKNFSHQILYSCVTGTPIIPHLSSQDTLSFQIFLNRQPYRYHGPLMFLFTYQFSSSISFFFTFLLLCIMRARQVIRLFLRFCLVCRVLHSYKRPKCNQKAKGRQRRLTSCWATCYIVSSTMQASTPNNAYILPQHSQYVRAFSTFHYCWSSKIMYARYIHMYICTYVYGICHAENDWWSLLEKWSTFRVSTFSYLKF